MTGPYHLDGDWWPEPVPGNVTIGERCYFYSSFAFRHYRSVEPTGVRVGDDTGIYEGTCFDLGPHGSVHIGSYGTLVAPIFATNGPVRIGDYAFIAHDVFIADDPAAVPPEARGDLEAPSPEILIGDNVWIGTKAVVLAGARLGEGAIVGAGSVVDFEVPDFAVVAGNPSRIVGSSPPGGRRPQATTSA